MLPIPVHPDSSFPALGCADNHHKKDNKKKHKSKNKDKVKIVNKNMDKTRHNKENNKTRTQEGQSRYLPLARVLNRARLIFVQGQNSDCCM